jgi:methylated-DNA-[protein]-cysteine S-methyltransferase
MIHMIVESPIGDLLLLGDGDSLVGLYTAEHVRRPDPLGDRSERGLEQAREELAEYFTAGRREFGIPLAARGTEFQRQVWSALAAIGYGQTASYRDIANRIGNPKAVRAVGMANGRNPISIIVPCHRVVGATGDLTGYAGGLAAKRWLLDHESHIVAAR